jgi:hypothetical protein
MQTLTEAHNPTETLKDAETLPRRNGDQHPAIVGSQIQCRKRRTHEPPGLGRRVDKMVVRHLDVLRAHRAIVIRPVLAEQAPSWSVAAISSERHGRSPHERDPIGRRDRAGGRLLGEGQPC